MGNQRLEIFPTWEMFFRNMPEDTVRIATEKVKWDHEYQKKHGIETGPAESLDPAVAEQIARICKRVYRVLGLSGYARMDLRLTADGRVYVLEANPNPNLEYGEDFSESAEKAGISYEKLLVRIVNLGLNYQAPWAWAPKLDDAHNRPLCRATLRRLEVAKNLSLDQFRNHRAAGDHWRRAPGPVVE